MACGQFFLTFIVPATDGCNLGCSFCFIRQRREVVGDPLHPEDLVQFIREAAERSPIFAVAIQGYEPLLPASLPYTQAVLATGRLLGLPTAMVSNGVLLGDAVDLLAVLAPSKIAISLMPRQPISTIGFVVSQAHGQLLSRVSNERRRF
jgi:molybdenum cofactor biosynthesis enzyme MoaA